MAFGVNSSANGVDLNPAETEIRKAYTTLLSEIQRLGNDGWTRMVGAASLYNQSPFATLPSMPVLHIQAKGRRVEYGWYRTGTWQTTGSKIATALGAKGVRQSHDEVFVAGEALSWHPEKLVELLIHQIIHQFAQETSDSTHHSHNIGRLARLIGYQQVDKHATRGFTEWRLPNGPLATVIMNVAKSISPAAFGIYRKDEGENQGSGRMKQWTCKCRKPKVYTGGVLLMTCDRCQQPLKYSHKDRMLFGVFSHLHSKGLPAERITPWWCSECGNEHNWDGALPYQITQAPNYPQSCYLKTGVIV